MKKSHIRESDKLARQLAYMIHAGDHGTRNPREWAYEIIVENIPTSLDEIDDEMDDELIELKFDWIDRTKDLVRKLSGDTLLHYGT